MLRRAPSTPSPEASIQRFGGSVEKFIGDAVVGLFGIPRVHEDDAERAVRAALEILEHVGELPSVGGERLRARAGVETGPVLVRLRVVPQSGEGLLVGDAVNTAARLLTHPPLCVVAGAGTHELTEQVIMYATPSGRTREGKDTAARAVDGDACGVPTGHGNNVVMPRP